MEEFPHQERKHYDRHAAKREALGPGLAPVGDEQRQFDHFHRANQNVADAQQAGSQHPEEPRMMSSYQSGIGGGGGFDDGVGSVKKYRPAKKMVQPAYGVGRGQVIMQEAPGRTVPGAPNTGATHTSAQIGSLIKEAGFTPGYTGHVSRSQPQQAESRTGLANDSLSKNMLVENYKGTGHIPGYTGRASSTIRDNAHAMIDYDDDPLARRTGQDNSQAYYTGGA
eukprot:CAMPEP_0197843448 /NCGR_PEP_ID=MMETSP1438-20131217/334_1 /TAXON_ID=1461541 /ORGANISM="Pterosperma sp., Strain CCMP1384" /LENGTH=223 /DNA_ID=CAMNT_0043453607 /DNA_START=25 /DNA_END=695 /DNA_ORIENTATION=-